MILRISNLPNNYFFYDLKYKKAQRIAKSEDIKTDSKEYATYAALYADF